MIERKPRAPVFGQKSGTGGEPQFSSERQYGYRGDRPGGISPVPEWVRKQLRIRRTVLIAVY